MQLEDTGNDIEKVLLTEEQIKERVEQLGAEISLSLIHI